MKTLFCLCLTILLMACSPKKPPLEATQIIDGQSIVVPPEFNTVP